MGNSSFIGEQSGTEIGFFGNLSLSGACNKATYSVDGVGNLNAVGMKTASLDIHQDGVGNISCFASKRLSVKSEGVGNVKYAGNPVILKKLEQQKSIELAKLKAEKSKLLPTFSIGYNNSSMFGTGADDQFYNRSARFHSGMIGVGIPLFNGAQKSLIEGQKINQLIAENNYEVGSRNLKNQYSSLFSEYEKLKNETDYYKTKGLQNAETIFKTANRLYYEGEINYLEWSILTNQSLDIQNKNIDTQKMLNEKIIQLNNLTEE